MRSVSDHQAELLSLHNRLLSDDPVVTEEIFRIVVPDLERNLRTQFPELALSVDPDIYTLAVYEALTDYFKDPSKYDPSKRGLMGYLRMACRGDMLNLLRKESRHAKGRVSLEDVEFQQSDGNNISEIVADKIDGERQVEKLIEGMTPVEREVFSLMMEGERSTRAAAEAMGIGHLAPREQYRQVKRVKDRIKKRIQRRGIV